MFVVFLIGFLALAAAVLIVGAALRRHQRESGAVMSWNDVKEAFRGGAIKEARHEAALLSEPAVLESDLRVGDLLAQAEDGSGYIEPRDILTLRTGRD